MANRYNTGNPRPSNSMKDLNDNALAYDDFLNGEQDEAYDRFQKPFPTVRRQVADRIDEITGAQKSIEQYTDEAKQAADNAQNIADANTYYITPEDPDGTIAGIAGTPSGKSFRVAQGVMSDYAFIYYINNNGIAEPVSVVPGMKSVNEVRSRLKTVRDKFRNAFIDSKGKVGAGLNKSMAWCALALQSKAFNITDNNDEISMQIVPQRGKVTFSKNGKVAMEIKRNGQVRIAKLTALEMDAKNLSIDFAGKDISKAELPSVGAFQGNSAGELTEYVALNGMPSSYGNQQTASPGVAMRRIGTVLKKDVSKSWMSSMVESPAIWWDDSDLQYHMVFTAYSGTFTRPENGSIGHATSIDLVNWNVGDTPILVGSGVVNSADRYGCTGPYMLRGDDGKYYLFYIGLPNPGYEGGIKRICLAVADSLADVVAGNFTRMGVLIGPDSSKPWRSSDVYHVSIVKRNNVFYMFFNSKGTSATGGDDSQGNERIGYAYANSLTGPWIVDDANAPIINTKNGTWKSAKVGDPSVRRDGKFWYMSYFGFDGSKAYDSIAVTTDDKFPLGWVELGKPTLSPIPFAINESKYVHKPWITVVGGKVYHFTTGEGADRVITLYVSGAGVDDRFAPRTDGVVRNVITPTGAGGEAVDEYSPEVSNLPVIRAGQRSDGSWQIYRPEKNGFSKSNGIRFDGRNIEIGDDSQLPTTAVDGFLYIPSINGVPTGTPSSKNGKNPICVDAANKKLWVYISGAWFSTNLL
ncbi:hypothetical protein [Serratia sp. CY74737]|uniref:hypothetical protein n=1 Tax=Serratia sp. CY74737 TaxID=3383677 RepID=UPI003FA138C2